MGQAESKEVTEDDQYGELKKIAETEGPAAVSKYLKDNVHKWKEEKVAFAVTGRSATGKSSFINKIRDVKPKDPGFAKSGSGNTTIEPTAYENPHNKRIVFYDLPGVGTMEFPKITYVSKMKLQQYDYFFIFFDKVVSEDDYFLIRELFKLKKSFCLVRSKIDEDLRNAEADGKRETEVLPAIRKQIIDQVSRYEHLKDTDAIFLISCRTKDKGDWYKLLEHIGGKIRAPKFESFMYYLPTLTENVINLKYKTLKKRLHLAAASAATIAAVPFRMVDVVANIGILVEEVLHYLIVFGLDKKTLATLDGFDRNQLKCAEYFVPPVDIALLIVSKLQKTAAVLPGRYEYFTTFLNGSTEASAVLIYRFLSKILSVFRDDAVIVYRYIIHLESQRI